ncbi:TetR/AcrR family transcriptional regulator [Gluconacetobacter azotocaptans]|uniref:TetR/AcrR family transcriptional regulator n=1 Tax=Gluconacetobacter azotocaptans TaxID=142834 RepID=UPI0030B82D60
MPQLKGKRRRRNINSRSALLTAANSLFSYSGFHQISVDEIAQRADVAKTALYHHFGSKEGLVVEFLGERIDNIEVSLAAAINAQSDPRARLKAVFDWHAEWFRQPDFAGCVFSGAAREYKGKQDEIVELTKAQKRGLRHALRVLAETAGVAKDRSDALAHHLIYLLDGAIVSANVLDEKDAAERAWEAAEGMLDVEIARTKAPKK